MVSLTLRPLSDVDSLQLCQRPQQFDDPVRQQVAGVLHRARPRMLVVCNSWLLKRIAYTTMPYKTRNTSASEQPAPQRGQHAVEGVPPTWSRYNRSASQRPLWSDPANGFPARLLGRAEVYVTEMTADEMSLEQYFLEITGDGEKGVG